MRRVLTGLVLVPMLLGDVSPRDMREDSARLKAIHDLLRDSVVQIELVVRDEFPSGVSLDTDKSSVGLVVSADGLILGPGSVVEAAGPGDSRVVSVTIFQHGGRQFDAILVGQDRETGIVFFQVKDPDFSGRPLEFDRQDGLSAGDFIATLRLAGPNFGRTPYLDAFLVSGALEEPDRCYLTTFAVSDYLGGPVVTMDGRVVGMVGWMRLSSANQEPPGLRLFASVAGASEDGREVVLVPASRFIDLIEHPPVTDAQEPPPRPAWLGVETQPLLPELAEALGWAPSLRGVLITRVLPGSPAGRAGLEVADLIHELDGHPLCAADGEAARAFQEAIDQRVPGDRLQLSILRAGQTSLVRVELEAAPLGAAEADREESIPFGLGTRDLVHSDRADQQLAPEIVGARVTRVTRTGFCGLGGLQVRDIVLRVNGEQVADSAGLCARLERAATEREEELVLFVIRGPDTLFVHVQPDWDRVVELVGR